MCYVCYRCLFSLPLEIEMARKQGHLGETCYGPGARFSGVPEAFRAHKTVLCLLSLKTRSMVLKF